MCLRTLKFRILMPVEDDYLRVSIIWATLTVLNSMEGLEGRPKAGKPEKRSNSSLVSTALNTSISISAQWQSSILSPLLCKKEVLETREGFESFQNFLAFTFKNLREGIVIKCGLSILQSGFICPSGLAIGFPRDLAQGLAWNNRVFLFSYCLVALR